VYEGIKRLAVEAVKLQNKLNMEATLNEIVMMCDSHRCSGGCSGISGDDPIAAGDVLVGADGAKFKVDAVIAPKKPRAKVAK
jgi:hypothetical protein